MTTFVKTSCFLSNFAGNHSGVQKEVKILLDSFHGMQVFLRAMDGRHIAIEVAQDESIDSLKQSVYSLLNIQPNQQILSYAGKVLQAGNLLDYSVQKDCTITVALGLPGGAVA
jgi:hypothetical protein